MEIVHYCICNSVTAMQLKVLILQISNDWQLPFNEEVTSPSEQ